MSRLCVDRWHKGEVHACWESDDAGRASCQTFSWRNEILISCNNNRCSPLLITAGKEIPWKSSTNRCSFSHERVQLHQFTLLVSPLWKEKAEDELRNHFHINREMNQEHHFSSSCSMELLSDSNYPLVGKQEQAGVAGWTISKGWHRFHGHLGAVVFQHAVGSDSQLRLVGLEPQSC